MSTRGSLRVTQRVRVRACVCIHVHTRACVRMRARVCACEGTGAARVDPCRSRPHCALRTRGNAEAATTATATLPGVRAERRRRRVEAHLTAARFSPSLMRSSCTARYAVGSYAGELQPLWCVLTMSCSEEGPDAPRTTLPRCVGTHGPWVCTVVWPLERYSGHLKAVLWAL